jgi:YHS domain-containing protein
MKRMGFLMVAVVIVFLSAAFNSGNTIFANSCCGVKEKESQKECNMDDAKGCVKGISSGESSGDVCPVCGKAADSKGQQVDVEHDGKTTHLCCEGCANAYNANPDKYSKSESEKPKSESEKPGQSHREQPKEKKQRGEGYY